MMILDSGLLFWAILYILTFDNDMTLTFYYLLILFYLLF